MSVATSIAPPYGIRQGAGTTMQGCAPQPGRMGAPSPYSRCGGMLSAPVRRSTDRVDWMLDLPRGAAHVQSDRHTRPGAPAIRCAGWWPARPDPPTPDRRLAGPDARTDLAARDPQGPGRPRRAAVRLPLLGRDPDGLDAGLGRRHRRRRHRWPPGREDPVPQGTPLAGWLAV